MSLLSGTSWWHNSTWRDGNVEGGRLPVNQDDNEDDDDNIDDNGNGVDDNNDDDVGVWEKPRHHPLTCAWGSRSVRHPGCRCLPLIHVSGPRHSHHYHRHHNHNLHHHHHHHYHHPSIIVFVVASLSYQPDSLEDTTIILPYQLIAINDSSSKQHWIWSAKHECFGCGVGGWYDASQWGNFCPFVCTLCTLPSISSPCGCIQKNMDG